MVFPSRFSATPWQDPAPQSDFLDIQHWPSRARPYMLADPRSANEPQPRSRAPPDHRVPTVVDDQRQRRQLLGGRHRTALRLRQPEHGPHDGSCAGGSDRQAGAGLRHAGVPRGDRPAVPGTRPGPRAARGDPARGRVFLQGRQHQVGRDGLGAGLRRAGHAHRLLRHHAGDHAAQAGRAGAARSQSPAARAGAADQRAA